MLNANGWRIRWNIFGKASLTTKKTFSRSSPNRNSPSSKEKQPADSTCTNFSKSAGIIWCFPTKYSCVTTSLKSWITRWCWRSWARRKAVAAESSTWWATIAKYWKILSRVSTNVKICDYIMLWSINSADGLALPEGSLEHPGNCNLGRVHDIRNRSAVHTYSECGCSLRSSPRTVCILGIASTCSFQPSREVVLRLTTIIFMYTLGSREFLNYSQLSKWGW